MDVVQEEGVPRKAHTFRGLEEKRRIVEETLRSGVSVSSVARAHGINANQVFQWRKLYRDGLLDVSASGEAMRLLPVAVLDEGRQQVAGGVAVRPLKESALDHSSPGLIELTFEWGQLRIAGAVDRETLRTVLGCLLT